MCFSGTLLVSQTVVSTPPLTDCSPSGSVPLRSISCLSALSAPENCITRIWLLCT